MTEIKTAADLEACADGTVVLNEASIAWQRLYGSWYPAGSDEDYDSESLFDLFRPLTLVYAPGGAA